MEKVDIVYFSGSGTTREIARQLAEELAGAVAEHDLVRNPPQEDCAFGSDEAVVFALPVYGGRLPGVCVDMLRKFHGAGTRAVAVVVYGNRAFDDALLELSDVLDEQGFVTVAAAAFVAQHSLFPKVAAGRPDASDRGKISEFARRCEDALTAGEARRVEVPGNRPYVQAGAVSLQPSGNARCNGCDTCARLCPTGAIDAADPRKTDKSRCIACTACIAACPQGARGFHTPIVYPLVGAVFAAGVKERREPEFFLA